MKKVIFCALTLAAALSTIHQVVGVGPSRAFVLGVVTCTRLEGRTKEQQIATLTQTLSMLEENIPNQLSPSTQLSPSVQKALEEYGFFLENNSTEYQKWQKGEISKVLDEITNDKQEEEQPDQWKCTIQ